MLKVLKNLFIAMINATLILVVLSLFLAWKVTSKADQIATDFARNMVSIQPVQDDIQAATEELAAMRSDLATMADQSAEVKSVTLKRIEMRLTQIQGQMDTARQSLSTLSQAPTQLVDHAIDRSADRAAQVVSDFRNCKPQS